MPCGCNKKIQEENKLLLDEMKSLSIDEIVNLYRQGYRLENSEENYVIASSISDSNNIYDNIYNLDQPKIYSLATAYPNLIDATAYYDGTNTYTVVMWTNSGGYGYAIIVEYDQANYWRAQTPNTCYNVRLGLSYLTVLQTSGSATYFDVEAAKCPSDTDQTCSPPDCTGTLIITGTLYSVPVRAKVTTVPTTPTGLTVTPGNGQLSVAWNAVTNTDIFAYHLKIIRNSDNVVIDDGYLSSATRTYVFSNLTNATAYTVRVSALSNSNIAGSEASQIGTPQGPTFAQIYDLSTNPTNPNEGDQFTITASIANTGPNGKVRVIIKVNGTAISGGDQQTTLNTYPVGGLWNPSVTYTMPGTTIVISAESYGTQDNGATWILDQTQQISVTPGALRCTGITLTPFSSSIDLGQSVTFTATADPSTQAFTVNFRLVETGASLGTCNTSGGSCQFIWNTANTPGLVAGNTYHVIAEVIVSGITQCYSTQSAITLSAPIRQWLVNIYVNDSSNVPVQGANVTIGTQTLTTNSSGYVQFLVNEGTIDISISKTGYTTITDVQSLFSNITLNYVLSLQPGNLNFITVPTSVDIYFGTTLKGTTDATTGTLLVQNISAGTVVNYTAKKAQYNDYSGSITVPGGMTTDVAITLTRSPGTVCIRSNPSGAAIKVDGNSTGKTTALSPSGGCTSSNWVTNLTEGSHTYLLSLTGYQDKNGSFNIIAGQTTDVDAGNLTPIQTQGSLTITSNPQDARIFIDNVDTVHITPATITGIDQGNHSYKLTLNGYQDKTGTFAIAAGQTTTVDAGNLVPLTGNVYIESNPQGAAIYIDDVLQTGRITPTTLTGLLVGTHTYKLTLTGYQDETGAFDIIAGQTRNISVTFTPLPGSVQITTIPAGAAIYIDDVRPSGDPVTPATVSNLSSGSHYYRLTLANYYDATGTITIISNQGITLDVSLTPIVASVGGLYIESTPKGAAIYIDGLRPSGNPMTPATIQDLTPGPHTYKLTLAGYQDKTASFGIIAGEITPLFVTLQQIAQAGFGGIAGLFLIGGLAVGSLYLMTKRHTTPTQRIQLKTKIR